MHCPGAAAASGDSAVTGEDHADAAVRRRRRRRQFDHRPVGYRKDSSVSPLTGRSAERRTARWGLTRPLSGRLG
jgi:hypothetical protein